MPISSRFNRNLYFYLLLATVCSFLFSLFLLEVFAGILSILWIFEKIPEKKKAIGIFGKVVFIFLLARVLSIIFSDFPSVSNQSYYKDALFYLGFFSFDFYLKTLNKKRLNILVYTFAAASVIIAISGLVLFNLHMSDRARSFSSGYATFSSYLLAAFGIFICLPVLLKREGIFSSLNINNFIKLLSLSIIFTGVITSLGRTNVVIIIILLAAGVIIKKVRFRDSIIIIILTIILSSASFINNSPEFGRRVNQPTDLSDRNVLLKGAEDLFMKFQNPLLGYGPRTFKEVFPYRNMLSDKGIGSWHNDFIQVYFESGFLGLSSFLILLIISYYYIIKLLREDIDIIYKNIIWGICLGLSGLILSAFTAGFIDSPVLSIVFAFLISLISGINYVNATVKN